MIFRVMAWRRHGQWRINKGDGEPAQPPLRVDNMQQQKYYFIIN